MSVCLYAQTLHGTAIYADQLGWFWGVHVGIYASAMECLGCFITRAPMTGKRRRDVVSSSEGCANIFFFFRGVNVDVGVGWQVYSVFDRSARFQGQKTQYN